MPAETYLGTSGFSFAFRFAIKTNRRMTRALLTSAQTGAV